MGHLSQVVFLLRAGRSFGRSGQRTEAMASCDTVRVGRWCRRLIVFLQSDDEMRLRFGFSPPRGGERGRRGKGGLAIILPPLCCA